MSKCANGGVRAPAKQGLTHKTHHRTKRRGVQVSRVSETDLLKLLCWHQNAADDSEFDAFLPYTKAIHGTDKYDVVLVAGRFRVACLLEALPFVAAGGTVFLQNAQRYLALHYSRNQLATPRRWLPHITASYTLNAAGKRRIGKRNNAVLRKYYDVVAMTPDVVALRPKPSTNETWEEDLAAARRDPC